MTDKTTSPHETTRDSLKFLWEQYRASHMSNLMYSISLIGAVLLYLQKIDPQKLASIGLQSAIEATLGFAMLAAGLAMIQRFTSQFFMEMEIFSAPDLVDDYYKENGTLHTKATYSYAYGPLVLESTRYLHNLSKLFSSFFLYTSLFLFINFIIIPLQRNVSRTLTCNLLDYWYALPALLFISFSIVYVPMRISDISKSKTTRDGQ
jgi:hypothetical protein